MRQEALYAETKWSDALQAAVNHRCKHACRWLIEHGGHSIRYTWVNAHGIPAEGLPNRASEWHNAACSAGQRIAIELESSAKETGRQ